MNIFIDYYDLLGLSPNASEDLIKKAYRIASKKVHPDVGGSEADFILLKEAYEVLINPNKRKEYDVMYYQMESLKYKSFEKEETVQSSNEKKVYTEKKETSVSWKKFISVLLSIYVVLGILAKLTNNIDNSTLENNTPITPYVSTNTDNLIENTLDDTNNVVIETPQSEEVSIDEPTGQIIQGKYYEEYYVRLNELSQLLDSEVTIWETGSTSDILNYSQKEYELWDDLLNEIYSVLKEELSKEEFIQLRNLQREWIVERDKVADSAIQDFLGGTLESPIYISVKAFETKKRCYWLVENYF